MIVTYKSHKIFAFSDTHGMYRQLQVPEGADILICAGDACEGFNPKEMVDFFEWYSSIPAKLRIFVAGNHDMIFDVQPVFARSLIPDNVTFMENDGIEFDGITFYSVAARPYLKAPVTIPANLDFLITHGPAYSHLDHDKGDRDLFLAVSRARPKYHIFGHIHGQGQKIDAVLGGTTFVNVAYYHKLRAEWSAI